MLIEEQALSELVGRLAGFGEEHRDHQTDLATCTEAIAALKIHHSKARQRADEARANANLSQDSADRAKASELRRAADTILARIEAAVSVKEVVSKVETLGSLARSTARRFNHVAAVGVAVTQEL